MKGIEIWIFSKITMLIFTVAMFGIFLGFNELISEKAFADSAEVLTIQIKDGFQGVTSSGSLESQKVIPIPDRLPEGVSAEETRNFIIDIEADTSEDTLSTAISWDVLNVNRYSSASLLFIDFNKFNFNPTSLRIESSKHDFLVIKKTGNGGINIDIFACEVVDSSGCFSRCTPSFVC